MSSRFHPPGERTRLTLRPWESPHRMTLCMFADGVWPFAERTWRIKPFAPSPRVGARTLHELVHAARHMRGLLMKTPMNGGYGNQEEFLAQVIENIYRSEKGRSPIDYGGAPMSNPGRFLDSAISPSPRLSRLRQLDQRLAG